MRVQFLLCYSREFTIFDACFRSCCKGIIQSLYASQFLTKAYPEREYYPNDLRCFAGFPKTIVPHLYNCCGGDFIVLFCIQLHIMDFHLVFETSFQSV